ncbi:MAG: hypothetical protein CR993_03400 [Rhodobacterales bacterium]|nr:MAG: hypothetical protein CR993_03400 [Rhodobacterales bacterium]
MSKIRFAFLLAIVIACAGATVAVLVAALGAEALTGDVFFTVLPLILLGSIALRGLTDKDRGGEK